MELDIKQLAEITKRLEVQFIDREPQQTLKIEDFSPIYFSNRKEDYSDDLPGGGCGENMRAAYTNHDQCYEPLVTAFFILLKQQMSQLKMIDVGALWGHTSFVAASIFNGSEFHFFEMNPLTAKMLQKNVELNTHLNSTFHIRNVLLSKTDQQSQVTFKHYTARYGDGEGGSKLSGLKIIRENLKASLKKLFNLQSRGQYISRQMSIMTLDTYCQTQNYIPNLIKIDVEGSQYDILLGAQNTLKQHHPLLLVEFDSPDAANYIGKSNRELVAMLSGLGYRCIWGDHRVKNTQLHQIDENTEINIEVNSLGIFY